MSTANVQTVYRPNHITRISPKGHPEFVVDLLGDSQYDPIVHRQKDKNSLSQKWRVKNLEPEGGSGEFVAENVAVPGTYLTATALTVDAPLYGSPDATIWIKQVDEQGHSWWATSYKHYRFTYVPRIPGNAPDLAPAVLRPPKIESEGTSARVSLRAAAGVSLYEVEGYVFEEVEE